MPAAIALDLLGAPSTATFFVSALALVPGAALMTRATEALAARCGPGIGGLLNVSFGNGPELIVAIFALIDGLQEVVKASLIGSMLGNILLVLGAAMVAGGLRRERQYFNRTAAVAQSSVLMLAAVALAMPAVFALVRNHRLPALRAVRVDYGGGIQHVSLAVAVVLILTYAAVLLFSLHTHRELFNPPTEIDRREPWSTRRALVALAFAAAVVAGMSEILVHALSGAARSLGLSQFFIGIIVVAIAGNAAEHWVAVSMAARDKLDLAVNIAIGSSAQIALLAMPLLVLLSFVVGPHPMALVLNGFELAAVFLAILIADHVTDQGESTWLEGVQLLAVYLVLAIVFGFA